MHKFVLIFVLIMTILSAMGWGVYYLIIHNSNGSLMVDGTKRRYILHQPESYDPSTPTPLVISLHGFADWPNRHMRMTEWNELADEEGFIVVYPMGTGLPLRWRMMEFDGVTPVFENVIFIEALIQQLETQFNIDSSRIYLNGFSNGGGMTFMLACSLPERFAAIGSIAGAYFYPRSVCDPGPQKPMIVFHGTDDEVVPFDGGEYSRYGYPFPVIPDLMESIAVHNNCTDIRDEAVSENVMLHSYSGCESGMKLEFYTILGGGHSWPGGRPLPKMIVGETNQEVNATRLMWEFFQRYPEVDR